MSPSLVFHYANKRPTSDHCSECGGEEYNGATEMELVHQVILDNDGYLDYAFDTTMCADCVIKIEEEMSETIQKLP